MYKTINANLYGSKVRFEGFYVPTSSRFLIFKITAFVIIIILILTYVCFYDIENTVESILQHARRDGPTNCVVIQMFPY